MQVPLHRVLPVADGPITVPEAYAAPLGRHDERPWVGLCMVASIDGSTVVDGVSAGLSSANDSSVLLQLRSVAQVIIVGAGTMRGEGYGKPKTDGQRIGVVTRSGAVDTTSELFRSGAGFIITTEQTEIADTHVDVLRAGDADLFDELNVTMSPATVGGGGPRLFHGGENHSHRYGLEQLVVDDESFLFSRWRRRAVPTSP